MNVDLDDMNLRPWGYEPLVYATDVAAIKASGVFLSER
jgi:hypothetical protein